VAFHIKAGKSLPPEIRRMAHEQIQEARAALADVRRPLGERVHDVRTAMKKVRALNRLVRPAVGRRARHADRRLRKIAHAVSSLRDAEVVLKTYDRAVGPSRAALAAVRSRLAAHLRAEAQAFEKKERSRRLRADLAHERRKVEDWMPKARGWSAIDEGLSHGYRRARQAMAAAYRTKSGTAFHDWRRAVKTHRHQIAALETIAPGRMKQRLDRLDHLGDLLGDEHDLTVLEATVGAELALLPDPRKGDHLLHRIADRRDQLRKRARPLGKRLFAERPSGFRNRARANLRAAGS
jgi:CHAD domain-containing protein